MSEVMATLGRVGGDRGVPALSELALSAGSHRSNGAIRALGATGSAQAVGPLLRVLELGSRHRRGTAAEALKTLGVSVDTGE